MQTNYIYNYIYSKRLNVCCIELYPIKGLFNGFRFRLNTYLYREFTSPEFRCTTDTYIS